MNHHQECPECDSWDTKVVNTEFYEDMIERVRVCEDCPAQFTVNYSDPQVREVMILE